MRVKVAQACLVSICALLFSAPSSAQVPGMSQQQFRDIESQYKRREKSVLEQVFNYQSYNNTESGGGLLTGYLFWISGFQNDEKCIMTEFNVIHPEDFRAGVQLPPSTIIKRVNIREINQTAFRLVPGPGIYGGNGIAATDGKFLLNSVGGVLMDRLQKAWGLAFEQCPGKKSAF